MPKPHTARLVLEFDLAAMVFGAPYGLASRRPVPASPPDSTTLAPFAGRYEIAPVFVLTVAASRRGLSLAGTDGAFLPVDTTSPPHFFFCPLYVDITFERDSTQVVSLDWGGQVKAKRIP